MAFNSKETSFNSNLVSIFLDSINSASTHLLEGDLSRVMHLSMVS